MQYLRLLLLLPLCCYCCRYYCDSCYSGGCCLTNRYHRMNSDYCRGPQVLNTHNRKRHMPLLSLFLLHHEARWDSADPLEAMGFAPYALHSLSLFLALWLLLVLLLILEHWAYLDETFFLAVLKEADGQERGHLGRSSMAISSPLTR